MMRFGSLVSLLLAASVIVGCGRDDEQPPPIEDSGADTAVVDSTRPDTTVTDTGVADTAIDDTGSPDTGTPGDTSADAEETAVDSTVDDGDTTVDDASDAAVDDTSDSAVDDASDAAVDDGDVAVDDAMDAADADVPLPAAEVWVVRVGSGAVIAASTSAEVNLEKYSLGTKTLGGTIALPTAVSGDNQPLTLSISAGSEGALARSGDGRYVTLGGYAAGPGVANIGSTATTATPRVVGRIDAAGTVDTSTTTTSYSANNIRSAVTMNGSSYWMGGNGASNSGGVRYIVHGGSGPAELISTGLTNTRVAAIFPDGALYSSLGATTTHRVFNFDTVALPTTATTPVQLPGIPTTGEPYGIAGIATGTTTEIDTLYVCDERAAGGVLRYKKSGTDYALSATFGTPGGCRGLAVSVDGTNVLIVVTTTETPNRLVAFLDTTAGLATSAPIPVATAATNTLFRGVAFAPSP
jgi:hypothetical protein